MVQKVEYVGFVMFKDKLQAFQGEKRSVGKNIVFFAIFFHIFEPLTQQSYCTSKWAEFFTKGDTEMVSIFYPLTPRIKVKKCWDLACSSY